MSISATEVVVMQTPVEAIDHVLDDLLHDMSETEVALTGVEVISHLDTLCEGYRCRLNELPAPFAMMSETAHRRGASFNFERSKFMDLLWRYRAEHDHPDAA